MTEARHIARLREIHDLDTNWRSKARNSVQAIDLELVTMGLAQLTLGRFGNISLTDKGKAAIDAALKDGE